MDEGVDSVGPAYLQHFCQISQEGLQQQCQNLQRTKPPGIQNNNSKQRDKHSQIWAYLGGFNPQN